MMSILEMSSLLAAAISTVGTLAIAGLTYSMVKEMKKTRENAIQPFLVLLAPKNRFFLQWLPKEFLCPIVSISSNNKENHPKNFPVFGLKNIGNGTARNIKVSWKINDNGINDILSKSARLNQYNARLSQEPYTGKEVLMIGSKNNFFLNVEDSYSQEIEYCPTSSSSKDFRELDMSPSLLESFNFRIVNIQKPEDIDKAIELPDIEVQFDYEDFGGKRFIRRYMIKSAFYYVPDNGDWFTKSIAQEYYDENNIRGYFSFTVRDN